MKRSKKPNPIGGVITNFWWFHLVFGFMLFAVLLGL